MPPGSSRSSFPSKRRIRTCLFVSISVALLVNTLVVFVAMHGQEGHGGYHHGVLRGGSSSGSSSSRSFASFSRDLASSFWSSPQISEEAYWREMILPIDGGNTSSVCNKQQFHKTNLEDSYNNNNKNRTTFQDDIRFFVEQHPNTPGVCNLPPTNPICQEKQYAVILYYYYYYHGDSPGTGNNIPTDRSMRSLVTHIMALLTYPSAGAIYLILPQQFSNRMDRKSTGKYWRLIQQWIDRGVVRMITATFLWEPLATILRPDSIPTTQAVLWLDATRRKDWNGTLFKSQLHSWRQRPDGLMGQRYNSIPELCRVPSLHGMMMHRNYLCLTNHPVVKQFLQQYERSQLMNWTDMTNVLSLILMQLSSRRYDMIPSATSDAKHDTTTNFPMLPRMLQYFGCPCSQNVQEHTKERFSNHCQDDVSLSTTG
ncbi:hypothetical protein IV203_008179 [Nitzschia inconspicua]|uniref:Uncharacterized protein n=1 Tax=Nitzschia inconspicua TaxID=303405 RepID=A0A9K3P832_9STRA|nr:hypothetical protein IV203_011095 [Nitzschia inconspicua]KAG7352131.1 hypothetical protein IV203_008179 [Nitzschia inconspicua]